METISFITSTLPLNHGGRTKSLLQRAMIFTENGKQVKIYTTNYNENYDFIRKELKKTKKINEKIEIINIYDYYKEENQVQKNNYKRFLEQELPHYGVHKEEPSQQEGFFRKVIQKVHQEPIEEDLLKLYEFKKKENSQSTYYYMNGRAVYQTSLSKGTDKIKTIDFYLPHYNKTVMRAYVDVNGNVHKMTYFEPGTEKIQSEVFLNSKLHPYLVKEYSYKNEKLKSDRCILTKMNGNITVFKTEKEFFRYWFEEIFREGEIVINDARLLDRPLMETNKKIKKIYQLHSSHLEIPEDLDSKTKGAFKLLLESDFKDSELIVALTESQKQNILIKHPHLKGKIFVIPHALEMKKVEYDVKSKQICVVSRLVPEKKLEDVIEAFKLFNEQIQGYTLLIYGNGEEKQKLEKLIKENNLTSTIKLMGLTDNPDQVFQESLFSVMSSRFEGLPLAVLESIANGCPVVSYDVNWGPSDILTEKSGRITKENTPEALCQEMIEEVRNPKNRSEVQERAKNFTVPVFYQSWSKLID